MSVSKFFGYLFSGRFGKIFSAVRERVPYTLYHRGGGSIFELTIDDHGAHDVRAKFHENYRCRPAIRDEMPASAKMTDLDTGEYYRRFDAGDICFTVFDNKRPANLNWIHRGSCYIRGMGYIHVGGEKDYYIYGIMTDSSERGRGLYKNCLIELARFLFDHGAEKLIQMVEDGNEPVLHTLPKLGYKRTTTIRHLTILGIKSTKVFDTVGGLLSRKLFVKPPDDMYII